MPPEAAGERLDRFLAACEGVGSRAEAERLLGAGAVLVDGSPRPKSHRLAGGEELDVELPERRRALEPEPVEGLRVAYEDEHLLVVDKPAGVVVHPSAGHAHGTVVHGLLSREIEGGDGARAPGHRPPPRSRHLRPARRRALGRGAPAAPAPAPPRGSSSASTWRSFAAARARVAGGSRRRSAATGATRRQISFDTDTPRDAITNFDVLETLPRHALLRVALETGRTHQIRVHLAAIDLPVSGDPVYGVEGDLGLERQFLHAARLAFPHPFTGSEVECESPLPPDLQAALEEARLSS